MKAILNLVSVTGALLLTLVCLSQSASAVPLNIVNHSFELPLVADGAFSASPTYAAQGGTYGWDWTVPVGAAYGIGNMGTALYTGSAGNNTPTGALGAQAGVTYRGSAATSGGMGQIFPGADGIVFNADDPVVTANTVYTLTVSLGQRLTVANPFGDLDVKFLAGASFLTTIFLSGPITPPTPGTFADYTFSFDSSTLPPDVIGTRIALQFLQNTPNAAAEVDNVRMDAVTVPEPSSVLLGLLAAAGVGAVVRMRRAG